ncbi:MAG: efflux RND transporter permease subunit [Isosphaeraceae bacterium]
MFNPISWALRRPVTVITLAVGLLLLGTVAARRMRVDIFPNLNLPVVYVCQPYGGMDPSQMEGLLTNYYEYHFLYINGIHHVESRNVQGLALMKLYFHPGTDMAQAMAETLGYVTRARAFMPPGTVSPFVTRFDAGSIPVGYLVLSSETRTINEIQDIALFKVRPMFAGLPGVSAPPPFGGSQRTIVVQLDPDRLKSYRMAPDEVIKALNSGNTISPSGTVRFGNSMSIVPVNALARTLDDFRQIPVRPGQLPTIHLGDVANVADAADVPVGSALVNGRKAVYLLVTKRADASTLDVVNNVKNALPEMQAVLPPDIKVSLEFDQSPTVTNAVRAVISEAILGALLVGLMVLLFLRDWRGMLIVIINIPLALAGAIFLLWISGQSFNLMTLGGLALAIGILVDESTVELENIHTQLRHTTSVPVAVRRGNRETAVPRLLALLCMLAVFAPSFLMTGAIRALFVPLSMSVGFAMICSYLLSSTLVPVLAAYLLKPAGHSLGQADVNIMPRALSATSRPRQLLSFGLLLTYLAITAAGIWKIAPLAGFEVFPQVDSGRFQVRVKAPAGTRFEVTEKIVVDVVNSVKKIVGDNGVEVSVGYVGNIGSSYPIQAIFQWTGGPEEAFLRVALDPAQSKLSASQTKDLLRQELAKIHPNVSFSFEPADIVSEVMSFGSPTPVEVVATGSALPDVRAYAAKLRDELSKVNSIRDLRYGQTLDYPALRVDIDRRRAGLSGLSAGDIARSLVTATSSSRFIMPSYWPDPKSGIGYQVQVEIPYASITSAEELANLPINAGVDASPLVLRDVATVTPDQVPGEFDRYNMKRTVSLTANVATNNLAIVSRDVAAAVKAAGQPPTGVTVAVRGQLATLDELNKAGSLALLSTFVVIFLLLTAYYQSWGLALVALSGIPAVGLGIALALVLTSTTWNLQSYMGAIMALGVSVANAIILVSFAESQRLSGMDVVTAANSALSRRLRPILMTALAMIAGMLPMALGLSEGGQQQAPLGRAVIGGLIGSLLAVVLLMPRVFAMIRSNASHASRSLDPTDPASPHFDPSVDTTQQESSSLMKNPLLALKLLMALIVPINQVQAQEAAGKAAAAPKVSYVKAKPALIERKIEQPGQVEPALSAQIHSRVPGWVKAVHVDIGDSVKRGQPLVEIDAPELEAELATSRAQISEALAQFELAKTQYDEAAETLKADQARLLAANADLKGKQAILQQFQLELDRIKKLVSSGAVTRSNLEEAEQKYLSASAELNESVAMETAARAQTDAVRAQLARRKADIGVAQARVELTQAKAAETNARHQFMTIRAPFDGVIVERNTDPGQLVGPSSATQPLLSLQKLDQLTVTVGVPEAEAPLVDVGDSVEIFTSQNSAKPAFTGKISRTSRAYHPATRTLRTEIDIPAGQSPLNSGQYVLVRVIGHSVQEAVTLPANAIYKVSGNSFCTVIKGTTASRVSVSAGVGDGTRVAMISGVKPGDMVIVGPAAVTLTDGQTVDAAELDETKK